MAEEVVRYVDIRPLINNVNNIQRDIDLMSNKINNVTESVAKVNKELEIKSSWSLWKTE